MPWQSRIHGGPSLMKYLAGLFILVTLLACQSGTSRATPLALTFLPPATAMPAPGARVVFQAETTGGAGPVRIQWLLNGVPLAGASAPTLAIDPVSYGNNGTYQVKVEDDQTSLFGPPFTLEPVDHAWQVTSPGDHGPGTLRDVLAETSVFTGLAGIQFAIPGAGPLTLAVHSDLAPITQQVCILGPDDRPLSLDAGGQHRPFFVARGRLILDNFTVAHGLARGGEALGGGGGAAGMGGAIFVNAGSADLRRMTFTGNVAQGGSSTIGGDGENGGGGGFGGDSPSAGGGGGEAGFLLGAPGTGLLDGSGAAGGTALGDGAGGGAARGGLLSVALANWSDNLPGGPGGWGAGGGFSVGPLGGGGDAGTFGGGGGGSGGVVTLADGSRTTFPGSAGGQGGVFGGEGGIGDGVTGGRGGGGAGCGGAVFVRAGSLVMTQCTFTGNSALPGQGQTQDGMGAGLGKGGAVFIYAYAADSPFDLRMLQGQQYAGNSAPDAAVEDAAFDNANWYVAQDLLADVAGSAFTERYRAYRRAKAAAKQP